MKSLITIFSFLILTGCVSTPSPESQLSQILSDRFAKQNNLINSLNNEQKRAYYIYLDAKKSGSKVAEFDAFANAQKLIPNWPEIIDNIENIQLCIDVQNMWKAEDLANRELATQQANQQVMQNIERSLDSIAESQDRARQSEIIMLPNQNNANYWQEQRAKQEYLQNSYKYTPPFQLKK